MTQSRLSPALAPARDLSKAPAPRRVDVILPLLTLAAIFVAAGEYFVTLRPTLLELPSGIANAVRPVWPHPNAVLPAIVLFVIAGIAFVFATRGQSACDRSLAVGRNPCGRPTRLVRIGIIGALLVWTWVLIRLTRTPTDWILPALFTLAIGALLATLAHHESRLLNLRGMRLGGWVRLEFVVLVALLALFAYLMIFDLTSWYYSTIGDEHAFFLFARELAQGDKGRSLFAQDGAYGIIPVLGSYFESIQMLIFGVNGVGWKIATISPVVLALACTYLLGRVLFNKRVGLFAATALATSHYLLAYGHSGYPNLEPLLPGVLAPLLFVLGIRRSSILLLIAAGLVAGLGWYTYYTSRIAIVTLGAATLLMVQPPPGVLRLVHGRGLAWRQRGRGVFTPFTAGWLTVAAAVSVGFALMVLPLFAVSKSDVLGKMFEQTGSGTTTEVAANRDLLPLWNTGRSLLAFNYNTHDGPWLSGSLLDPLTGALFVLGLAAIVFGWRSAANRFVLASFGIGLIVTGVLSKYDYVSVSRLNYLLPMVAITAAVAAERIVRVVEWRTPPHIATYVFPALLVLFFGGSAWGNLQRWFVDTPNNVPTTPTSVAIRIIEDPRCQTAPRPPVVVDMDIGGAVLPALDAAPPRVMPEFGLYRDTPTWMDSAASRCVIFRAPQDAPAQALQGLLRTGSPSAVPVQECDRSGQTRLIAYYPQTATGYDAPSVPCRAQ